MSTKTKQMEASRKRHDRAALIQWVTIGLAVALVLTAILLLTEADGPGHGGVISLLS